MNRCRMVAKTAFVGLVMAMSSSAPADTEVWSEGFESGGLDWNISDGTWEIGMPTSGPAAVPEGIWCAGTNLSGLYPDNKWTRLSSPWIDLPAVAAEERLMLKLRSWHLLHWDSYYGDDLCTLQVFDGTSWKDVWTISRTSPMWTQACADLTSYADSSIKLGFVLRTNTRGTQHGWFLDDLRILQCVPEFRNPENFEHGIGDWCVSNGIWEVAKPTSGPGRAASGSHALCTNPWGNYWDITSSLAFSAPVVVTSKAGRTPQLQLNHWYSLHYDSYYGPDYADVMIHNGTAWTTLDTFTRSSDRWTPQSYDLSAYEGMTVLIGFRIRTNSRGVAPGWYVDDVEISGIEGHCDVTFTEFGNGLAGSGGYVPHLTGVDGSSSGRYVLQVRDGLGQAGGMLFLSLGRAPRDLYGGTFYPDLTQPWLMLPITLSGAGDGNGGLNLFGTDISDYCGNTTYLQALFTDPGAPRGVSMTNGLEMQISQ